MNKASKLKAALIGLVLIGLAAAAATPAGAVAGATAGARAGGSNPAPPSAMTLGKAVAVTPAEQARERATAQRGVAGPATNRRATEYSGNWSGLLTSGSFQGIAGEWTVPSVQATTTNRYSSTWIGIDDQAKALIQTGTEEDSVSGHASYYAWFETLPAVETPIYYSTGGLAAVAPGDVMWSYLQKASGSNVWTVYLQDMTRGWTFTKNVTYATPGATVEWIHEATTEGGTYAPPPVFSKVTFSSLEVLEAGKWYYTTMKASSEVFMDQNNVIYATPSAPTNTQPQQFSVTYG